MNWNCRNYCYSTEFPLRLSYIDDYRNFSDSKIRAVSYTWKERNNGQKRCVVCEFVTADPCSFARCPCCNAVMKIQLKGSGFNSREKKIKKNVGPLPSLGLA